jgi:hypothetical protein
MDGSCSKLITACGQNLKGPAMRRHQFQAALEVRAVGPRFGKFRVTRFEEDEFSSPGRVRSSLGPAIVAILGVLSVASTVTSLISLA